MNPISLLEGKLSFSNSFFRLAAATCCAAALSFAAGINMPAGKVELKSAGALAMGPDGILFVGDSVGGADRRPRCG